MNQAIHRFALAILASSASLLLACGGQSANVPEGADSGVTETCLETPCSSNMVWNQARCQCDPLDASAPVVDVVTTTCPQIRCPAGSVQGVVGNTCACVPIDAGNPADSTLPIDARADVSSTHPPHDATNDVSDAVADVIEEPDVYIEPPDVYFYDAPPPNCDPTQCGPGFVAVPTNSGSFGYYCQCVACANDCPSGQTPAAGCGGCTACSYKCPAGFEYGSGCNCGPPGTDAGPNTADSGPYPPDAAKATCLLQGYTTCSAGSWCQLGTCPDGTTQYGCYCNPDGTANCDLVCPIPPPCTIPGQAPCPYGSQCVYGDCAADASSNALVCSCNSGASASCYTSSCGNLIDDGGSEGGVAGDGGVTCLLEGYTSCSAGSWCQLGICPDNVTPYGCTCNADGTATCSLTCPPASCTIPGEGTCPIGSSCTFGTCTSSSGTRLSCYCYSAGNAYCNTVSCADAGGD
jgi:hypothetical protein